MANITFVRISGFADGQKFTAVRMPDDTIRLDDNLRVDPATREQLIRLATVAIIGLSREAGLRHRKKRNTDGQTTLF